MDQLVVLHEIFESFAKGTGTLHRLDPQAVEGRCARLVSRLLECSQKGEIDGEICRQLYECFADIYELKRLGDICRRAGLLDLALKAYNKALGSARDTHVRAVLMNNLGQVHARQGDLNKAILYYKKASEGFEYAGNPSGVAHVLGNLGSAYRRGYTWDKSVECYFKSLRAFEKMNDESGAAQMTGSLGRVYSEMGETELAIQYFQKSLKEFERLGDKRSAAWVLSRMGKVHASQGRIKEAERCYTLSLSIFEELSQPQNSGIVLSNMGRMSVDQGDMSASRERLERALGLLKREMLPVYPNTMAALSAVYSTLAMQKLRGNSSRAKDTSKSSESQEVANAYSEASHLFAMASDGYQALSTMPRIMLTELKLAASLNRSLSYLAYLYQAPREGASVEGGAVSNAERAISSLESALTNSGGSDRLLVASVQRSLRGMIDLWSLPLARNEPWKMTKLVGSAIEYLLGSAREMHEAKTVPREAFEAISQGLSALAGSLESERQRQSGEEGIKAAALQFRRAALSLEKGDSSLFPGIAARMDSAGKYLETLVGAKGRLSDLMNYEAHRKALLEVSWTLIETGLKMVGRSDWIYVWDDAMNLSEFGPAGSSKERQKIDRSPEQRSLLSESLVDDGMEVEDVPWKGTQMGETHRQVETSPTSYSPTAPVSLVASAQSTSLQVVYPSGFSRAQNTFQGPGRRTSPNPVRTKDQFSTGRGSAIIQDDYANIFGQVVEDAFLSGSEGVGVETSNMMKRPRESGGFLKGLLKGAFLFIILILIVLGALHYLMGFDSVYNLTSPITLPGLVMF